MGGWLPVASSSMLDQAHGMLCYGMYIQGQDRVQSDMQEPAQARIDAGQALGMEAKTTELGLVWGPGGLQPPQSRACRQSSRHACLEMGQVHSASQVAFGGLSIFWQRLWVFGKTWASARRPSQDSQRHRQDDWHQLGCLALDQQLWTHTPAHAPVQMSRLQ